jgi:DNA-binding response OmpR family regulator
VEIRELNSELTRMGFACSVTNNGSNFSNKLTKQAYDVLLVDIDGSSASDQPESMLEQLRELRMTTNLPAIALISGKELSRLDSNLGIDDFVVKPWNISEVVTRAKRVIKQTKIQGSDLIKHGDLVMDTAECEVSISGRLITLTFKEYELLKFLMRHKGKVFTRDALLNEVWGFDYYGGDRTVDVHIRRLRSKIEDADHTYIDTVRNIGYKFSS